MKILLISEYYPDSSLKITGGVENRCYNVATKLSKKNEVFVLTSWRKGLKKEETVHGIKVYRVGGNHKYSNYDGFISRIKFAFSVAKKSDLFKDVDIIDAYNFTSYWPAYTIAKKIGKPVIATYHETWIGEWVKNKGFVTGLPYELFERYLSKLKFDSYISVSEYTKKRMITNGINEEKIVIFPNGVDVKEFAKVRAEKAKVPTLCYVGRLVETKKVDVLIKALNIVKNEFPDVKCRIVGQGKESARLKQIAKDFEVSENIEFLGFVEDSQKVMKIIKESHIFCLPSVLEGFGMVLIEAMALGIPYVCSDIAALKETTENGKGGLLFNANNHFDLAGKIIKLLKEEKTYMSKIEEGLSFVSVYDWKNITKEIEEFYKEIIRQK